jgi:hypothetical protein
MPAGALVTVPVPVPALTTARENAVPQDSLEYAEFPTALKASTR